MLFGGGNSTCFAGACLPPDYTQAVVLFSDNFETPTTNWVLNTDDVGSTTNSNYNLWVINNQYSGGVANVFFLILHSSSHFLQDILWEYHHIACCCTTADHHQLSLQVQTCHTTQTTITD